MIEKNGVNQMLEKHVETRSDEYWKKIIEDFQKIHENEERMERQLELEEAHKAQEEANKQVKQMVRKMYEDGFSLDQISEYCSLNVDEIQVLIKS